MSSPSLPPWTGGTGSVILETNTSTTSLLEPSGLTFIADGGHEWLYLASDHGEVARLSSQHGSVWQVQSIGSGKSYDFEAMPTSASSAVVSPANPNTNVIRMGTVFEHDFDRPRPWRGYEVCDRD